MLEKFRKRIVLINVLFVVAILIVVFIVSFGNSRQAILSSYAENFLSSSEMFEKQLTLTEALSFRDVYSFEKSNGLMVFLFDNHMTINTAYGQDDSLKKQLLADIKIEIKLIMENEKMSPNHWESTRIEKNFQLKSQGQDYFVRYVAILGSANSQYEIITAKSMADYKNELFKIFLFYTSITIISFTFIFLLNNLFAKKVIAPAIKAQKSQAEFLAAASHELKSPIAVIQSSAEMLTLDKFHHDEYIENITAESHRMARLVEDMLTLSRIDIDRLPFEKAMVDTEELLLSIYERFLPIAKKSNHSLHLSIPDEGLPEIFVDKDRLIQIFAILLDNAFCYTKATTVIELSATAKQNTMYISVIDHGDGIEDKEHIFDRFYRYDKSRTAKEHFGLGLSIAYEIAIAMQVSLCLTDTCEGGSTFCVGIPIRGNL